jgi:hypothetical protein
MKAWRQLPRANERRAKADYVRHQPVSTRPDGARRIYSSTRIGGGYSSRKYRARTTGERQVEKRGFWSRPSMMTLTRVTYILVHAYLPTAQIWASILQYLCLLRRRQSKKTRTPADARRSTSTTSLAADQCLHPAPTVAFVAYVSTCKHSL